MITSESPISLALRNFDCMAAEANEVEVWNPSHAFPPAPKSQALFNRNINALYTCYIIYIYYIYILYIYILYIYIMVVSFLKGFNRKESTESAYCSSCHVQPCAVQ